MRVWVALFGREVLHLALGSSPETETETETETERGTVVGGDMHDTDDVAVSLGFTPPGFIHETED